ncbi:MAG: ATP-binding protein [Arcobacteraceae bacterium]
MYAKFNIFSLRNRYIPALIIIAIFTLFAYINLKEIMDSIRNDGELINQSGRQRMFSQNIVLLSKKYLDTQNSEYKNQIETSALSMKKSHALLLQQLHSQRLKDLYFKNNLDGEVNSFLNIIDKFLETQDSKILDEMLEKAILMLEKLDLVVFEYEYIYKHKLEKLEAKEDFLFILTLLVLVLEAIVIFYPASKKIKINQEQFQNALTYKTKELQKSIDIISNYIIYSRTDDKGLITYASEEFSRISGFAVDELIGKSHNIVRHENMPKNYFEEILKTIKAGDSWRGEIQNKTKQGTSYWVDAYISPEYDMQGNFIGYVAIRHNITYRKEVEELNKNLQKRVSQELEKNRLKDNQLNEQAKIIEMNEMLVNIAHQWRQPLSFISTAASGLKVQKEMDILEDEFYYKTLDQITNTTQELSKTIDTLSGLMKKNRMFSDFFIHQLVNDTVEVMLPSLKEFHIEIVKDFEKKPIEIQSIASLLSQVILNILNNSKEAFFENKIRNPLITLSIKKLPQGVQFFIEDNAGGIKEEHIQKIFDPYFTTKHQSQGKGMGLHYCYNTVTQDLHGKIYAQNTQEGVKFFIELPFHILEKSRTI